MKIIIGMAVAVLICAGLMIHSEYQLMETHRDIHAKIRSEYGLR